MLRRIFGPKCEEAVGGSRSLYSEEMRDLNTSPSIIRAKNEEG
jgi:hypothetical protein